MTEILLDKASLVANIRTQFQNSDQLKYQRALQEFFDGETFIGDNVFETCFKLRAGLPPPISILSNNVLNDDILLLTNVQSAACHQIVLALACTITII